MQIILGLSLLEQNRIICDHKMRTCIHKGTNYDLLNPPEVKPPLPPKLRLREEIKITKANRKETLRELVSVVANK